MLASKRALIHLLTLNLVLWKNRTNSSSADQMYRATGEPACGDELLSSHCHRWGTTVLPKVKLVQLGQHSRGLVLQQSFQDARYKLILPNRNLCHMGEWLEKLQPFSRVHASFPGRHFKNQTCCDCKFVNTGEERRLLA